MAILQHKKVQPNWQAHKFEPFLLQKNCFLLPLKETEKNGQTILTEKRQQQSHGVGQAVNKRYGMEEWSSSASDLLIGIGSVCYDDISNSAAP